MDVLELGGRSPLNEWLEAIGAAGPTPAGGSAAAVAAALSAALVKMVAGMTAQREKYAAVHAEAGEARARAERLERSLVALAVRDVAVFAGFSRALELPRGAPEERDERERAKRAALLEGAEVQLELLGSLAEVAELAGTMTDRGLASAAGDAASASFLAAGAARSAYWAVRSNLEGREGEPEIDARLERALGLLERVEAAERRTVEILKERLLLSP